MMQMAYDYGRTVGLPGTRSLNDARALRIAELINNFPWSIIQLYNPESFYLLGPPYCRTYSLPNLLFFTPFHLE
jgi:hypothetical protein